MTTPARGRRDVALSVLLFGLTSLSTLYAGAINEGFADPRELWRGYPFAVPLMTILLCHEMGHYIAERIHGDAVTPPLHSASSTAHLDRARWVPSGFAGDPRAQRPARCRRCGPLAGLAVAVPILVYGIVQ